MGERRLDERIRELERELTASPGDAWARLSLARELSRAQRADAAASHVERVLRDDPLSRAGLEALDELGLPPLSRESPWPTVNGGNDRARRSSQPGCRKGILARRVRIGAPTGMLGDGSVERARSLTVGGDGCAYIATDKQRLIALDLMSEEPRWIRSDFEHPFAAPSVGAGERLALACQDTVRLLDGRTGETLWIARSPGVTSDTVPANATFAPRGLVLAPGLRGALYALDAVSGTLRWSFATRGAQYSSPAVDGRTIFVACSFKSLYAIGLDGEPRGLATADCGGRCGPVLGPESAYVVVKETPMNALVATRTADGLASRLRPLEVGDPFLVGGKILGHTVEDSAGCTFGFAFEAYGPPERLAWFDPSGALVKRLQVAKDPKGPLLVIGPDSSLLVPSEQGFLQVIE